MSLFVSLCLFLYVLFQLFCEVYSRLVSQTQQNPQDVSHFVSQGFLAIVLGSWVVFLPRLVTVTAADDACQFTYFFSQNGHIGQFRKVSYPIGGNPLIYSLLSLFYTHGIILCSWCPCKWLQDRHSAALLACRHQILLSLLVCLTPQTTCCRTPHRVG